MSIREGRARTIRIYDFVAGRKLYWVDGNSFAQDDCGNTYWQGFPRGCGNRKELEIYPIAFVGECALSLICLIARNKRFVCVLCPTLRKDVKYWLFPLRQRPALTIATEREATLFTHHHHHHWLSFSLARMEKVEGFSAYTSARQKGNARNFFISSQKQ